MPTYHQLSPEISDKIKQDLQNRPYSPYSATEEMAKRRIHRDSDIASVWRGAYARDIDKIMHCPYFNRYADKTQVFSLYKNDDITRRALHVQLVSRIARTIGSSLGLNCDLIEAISLGHDIGHTPFGHAGERYLDALLFAHTKRHFNHNIHSVRVLDQIFPFNISLQTLNGIACHNGELELSEYRPMPLADFNEFDRRIEACNLDSSEIKRMVPCTLEGCVVRISDIIAYLGKDRQDAERALHIESQAYDNNTSIGSLNAEFINNLIVNILDNSYNQPYIKMDKDHFTDLQRAKKENYQKIYRSESVETVLDEKIKPMMEVLYEKLLQDLIKSNTDSPIFTHHIQYIQKSHYERQHPYEETEPNQIVVDYIASMTDDYFIDLYANLFPDSPFQITYHGYFDKQ